MMDLVMTVPTWQVYLWGLACVLYGYRLGQRSRA